MASEEQVFAWNRFGQAVAELPTQPVRAAEAPVATEPEPASNSGSGSGSKGGKGGKGKGKAAAASEEKAGTGKKDKSPSKKGGEGGEKAAEKKADKAEAAPVQVDPESQRKIDLLRSVGEECVTESDLANLVVKKPNFILYDGFEPSGRMHIAQGVFKAMNVNKCTEAGGTFVFWVADWFALMNDKMGGDLDKIKTVGQYLIEVWKASGMNMDKVEFKWSSEEITKNAVPYWTQAIDIARRFTLDRVKKCCQIMGRKENSLTAAQILYPIMQCTDVFFLKADICQLGVDQRKVNMLAREYCQLIKRKLKPVILSHHMLYGLKKGQEKMSKSDPDSAIFMEDQADAVERKLMQAYCPVKPEEHEISEDSMHLVDDPLKNPCLDYITHIVFSVPNAVFEAGGRVFRSAEEVRTSFLAEEITPDQLKAGLVGAINHLLEPVRTHFIENTAAAELLEKVKEYKKEPTKISRDGDIRRLKLTTGESHVVFAPPAAICWTLGDVLGLIERLKAGSDDHKLFLWLPDWVSLALSRFDGDAKIIRASYTILTNVLTALEPNLMKKVTVMYQSDAILKDPSEYWISVINVGRRFQLQEVLDSAPPSWQTQRAGQVLAVLMHVGDMLALAPVSVACAEDEKALCDLTSRFIIESEITAVPKAKIAEITSPSPFLKNQAPDNFELAVFQEPDSILFALDTKDDIKRKLKRAFCEPGTLEPNPPLTLAGKLLLRPGDTFQVSRKPESGGPKEYTSFFDLTTEFESQALHPADLKPAVTSGLQAYLAPVQAHFKADKDAKAAEATLKAFIKKASKKQAQK